MRILTIKAATFLSGAVLLLFAACQKEFTPQLPAETSISSKDPKALSAAIKVWHGTRTQGAAPAPKGTMLQLDPTANTTVKAFAGRYATIKPEVLSGDVEGYYVGIAGSGQHFKVDYSNPRNINGRVRPGSKKPDNPFVANRVDSTDGNVDSSLVIVLPPDINVPDTFCITYCAYDSQGNISQPVTTCIIVNSLGGDANSGWLNANWKFTAFWENTNPHDTVIYNKWLSEALGGYECMYDSTSNIYFLGYSNWDNGQIIARDSTFYRRLDLTLSSNGAQEFEEDSDEKSVISDSSSCQQIKFSAPSNYAYGFTGAWSFNSVTNKILLVFETDSDGNSVVEAWEYDVIKINNDHFILADNYDPTHINYYRLQK
jgi:hypothetical protein